MKVVLISLERWDDVWRRNQHLTVELLRLGKISSLWFIEPPERGIAAMSIRPVSPSVVAVTPASPIPKRLGGLVHLGHRIRHRLVDRADLLWVNDPSLGVHCMTARTPTIYDVTDDWRTAGLPDRIVRRIVSAEDQLARGAITTVCSDVLHKRWKSRYGVDAPIVQNAIDIQAWKSPAPVSLPGPGPHVGYVGTLHEQRLDLDLVAELAARPEIGTIHLVGPDCLGEALSDRLRRTPGLQLHGAVAAPTVPGWMTAMDVLISPHLVNDFTLSLDAIKAHEYAASGRPVVATPTSGFQPDGGRTAVGRGSDFIAAVIAAIQRPPDDPAEIRPQIGRSWTERAGQFWNATGLEVPSDTDPNTSAGPT